METKLISYLLTKRPRDSGKVSKLKELYNETCQICGEPLIILGGNSRGIAYSEVCHIIPHGSKGLDDHPNMLVLCPNHHTLFDMGVITLDPFDVSTIIHLDPKNKMNKTRLKLLKHYISSECVKFHYDNIFLPMFRNLEL